MTYIENVLICMASPLLIAALCMGKRQTNFFLFCFAGMGACLLSAYINTFLTAIYEADAFAATSEIAPVVEEVMKLLPLLFYLLVFEPKAEQIKIAAVIVALSFATFENVCYLIQNGAEHFSFIFFRDGSHARHLWSHSGRRACLCVAADMVKNCRNLRPAGGGNYHSCNL
jgi:RsiW-degrading membrane proteinase PrsW (M82 family)